MAGDTLAKTKCLKRFTNSGEYGRNGCHEHDEIGLRELPTPVISAQARMLVRKRKKCSEAENKVSRGTEGMDGTSATRLVI